MKSIMLITGYSLLGNGLRRILELELSLKVKTVGDDQQVVFEQLLQGHDIVLFDNSVKNISCIELLSFLRQYSLRSQVLVLSSSLEHNDLMDLIVQGVSGYLTIDATPKDLLTAIQVINEGKKYVHYTASISLVKEARNSPTKNSSLNERKKIRNTLSTRELNILLLTVKGYSNREIAKKLKISTQTVTNNVWRIYRKLKVSNCMEAFLVVLKNNQLEIDRTHF